MKKWMFTLLAVPLFMPVAVLAQHSSKAAEARPTSSTAPKDSRKVVTISGQISLDGKTLVSQEDFVWNVSNPNVLAGREGQLVSVKCQVHPDKNEIQVFTIKVAVQELKSAANKGDSAFRR